MTRKRKIRQMRREILRMGEIKDEWRLKEPGLPKKKWGFLVIAIVNGYIISAPDDRKYDAYKGCLEAARWAANQPNGVFSDYCILNGKIRRNENG